MMNPAFDMKSFMNQLESANQIARVKCEVDPYLEVAAIVDKVCKSPCGGKALLFENVKGSSVQLAANLFGSMERMAIALGVPGVDCLVKKIERDLDRYIGVMSEQALLQLVQEEPCPDTIYDLQKDRVECRLTDLPLLHAWPGDGGKYLTLAQVFTRLPDSPSQNCGMYRVQIVDDKTALLRCHHGSGGEKHLKAWHGAGKAMPIAIALGGHPALTWAAGVSLPENVQETGFVSWLTGHQVQMSGCRESDLQVPAAADVVIEGLIHPGEEMTEGPFGNHTGLYTEQAPAPVIQVRSVTRTRKAIYPCTVVGPPPMENVYLAMTTQKLLLPLVKHDCHWVEDLYFPVETVYHRVAFVRLKPECDLAVEDVEDCLSSTLLLKGAKKIVLFDHDVELNNLNEAYWHLMNKADKSSFADRKLIDARTRSGQKRVKQSKDVSHFVRRRWCDYGL